MHYQIFHRKNCKPGLFEKFDALYRQTMSEGMGLARGVQKNMQRGLFINGQMHPRLESAVLHMQSGAREVLVEHAQQENAAGRQVRGVFRSRVRMQ